MYESTSNILVIGSFIFVTKVWLDIRVILKDHVKMNSYVQISHCALDIMKILRDESNDRKKRKKIK